MKTEALSRRKGRVGVKAGSGSTCWVQVPGAGESRKCFCVARPVSVLRSEVGRPTWDQQEYWLSSSLGELAYWVLNISLRNQYFILIGI